MVHLQSMLTNVLYRCRCMQKLREYTIFIYFTVPYIRLLHVNDKYMYIYYNISEIAMHILPTEKNPTVTNNSDNCFKFIQNVDGKNLTQKRLKLWNRFLFIFIYLLKCKDKSIVCTISSQYLLTCIKYGM